MSDAPAVMKVANSVGAVLSLVGAVTVYQVWGYSSLLLFFAAAVLCLTIALMWSSLQRIGESETMSFEEALSFSAPSATEEQKRAVLRTLKDLEYELHVGKISREDFDEVSAEVRKKAKLLIAQQDEDIEQRFEKAQARLEKFKRSQEVAVKKEKKKQKKSSSTKTKRANPSNPSGSVSNSGSDSDSESASEESPPEELDSSGKAKTTEERAE